MIKLIQGDCSVKLKELPENSVDSIVTDPPYELGFMGKSWDNTGIANNPLMWAECLRVLKPGGHLLAFSGTRTYHRMASAIEDAGFEVRDMIEWVYGSGFPKSLNIGKAVDKINGESGRLTKFTGWMRTTGLKPKQIDDLLKEKGMISPTSNFAIHYFNDGQPAIPTSKMWEAVRPICGEIPQWVDELVERIEREREVVGKGEAGFLEKNGVFELDNKGYGSFDLTKGTSEWEGWGTALKPAHEPIIISMKPLQVEQIFAILIDNIWNNLPVSDVMQNLRDTQAKLNEVVSSVPVNVRTNFLENLETAEFVEQLTTSLAIKLKKEKENSVQENVVQSGEEHYQETKILLGEEEGATLADIYISVQMGDISESIVLLWKNISEGLLNQTNTLTTRMAIRKIIELKTLRSCLIQNIGINTGHSTKIPPSHEPICMARKPLGEKTVAENCLKYGTGGINIDESRVGFQKGGEPSAGNRTATFGTQETVSGGDGSGGFESNNLGRFPANLIHDNSEEVRECFPDTGKSTGGRSFQTTSDKYGEYTNKFTKEDPGFGDSGNASRFFKSIIYTAKASKSERNRGCEGLEEKERVDYGGFHSEQGLVNNNRNPENRKPTTNNHPTVKPIALMEYLIKMVTPKGGIVLDPFMGSGSTGVAAKEVGFNFIGIEMELDYIKIAEARINSN